MYFIFKQSLIWDAYNSIDENQPSKTIRAKTEEKARRKLPVMIGRNWILVGTKK